MNLLKLLNCTFLKLSKLHIINKSTYNIKIKNKFSFNYSFICSNIIKTNENTKINKIKNCLYYKNFQRNYNFIQENTNHKYIILNKIDSKNVINKMNDDKKYVHTYNEEQIDINISKIWKSKYLILNFKNGIFEINLNRSKKLNAINMDMISNIFNILKALNNDERCNLIIIKSVDDKAFSAGSDVKDIVTNKEKGLNHLKQLYLYINFLSKINKPVLCIWNGYVMGGGIGLSIYSKYKVVSKNTKFAMPENKIGFFPDISSVYFLNKYFGRNIGLHLGLTGLQINEIDLINFEIVSTYIDDINSFLKELYNINALDKNDFNKKFEQIIKNKKLLPTNVEPILTNHLINNINKYYTSANTFKELIENLKKDEEINIFCKTLLNDLNNNCPFSNNFWYSYFIYNHKKELNEILDSDFKISQYFLFHIDTFEKGVTEILINKNRNFYYNQIKSNEIIYEHLNINELLNNKKLFSIKDEFI